MAKVKKKKKVKKISKKSFNTRVMILIFLFFVASALFLPTTFVVFFGMMPTWAQIAIDKTRGKLKSLAIGLMNFAGCSYVLMKLWTTDHTLNQALKLLLSPESLIIIYLIAGMGFALQAIVSAVVSKLLLEQTKGRMGKIEKQREEMIKRWGYEVTGRVPLDEDGFPLEKDEEDDKPKVTVIK